MENDEIKQELRELAIALDNVKKDRRSLAARVDNTKRANIQGMNLADNEFFFRVSMDFRGRLYYRSAHMNPQMGDDIKVMLTLADKKPLGPEGTRWLCWGVASACGVDGCDKLPFEERVLWTSRNYAEIKSIIREGAQSNLLSDAAEPALFLQRATELVNAFESGDYESYPTSITIAMDATCSGLQILSAVALDNEGGTLVNLCDSGKRQDIYETILQSVKDSYKNQTDAFANLMKENEGVFKRRFTKKVVMTLPYSAKQSSARDYVFKELLGNIDKNDHPFPLPSEPFDRLLLLNAVNARRHKALATMQTAKLDDIYLYRQMSFVIGDLILDACADGLPAALNLLKLFGSIPKVMGDHAYWVTPDGFKVHQVYGKRCKANVQYRLPLPDPETGEIISTKIQRLYLFLDELFSDGSKASNGMSPNWVHSLDGNLVRTVVNDCDFPVVCIHDSFAAHPADCNRLYDVLREQFVALVESKPLEALVDQLNMQIGRNEFNAEGYIVGTLDPKAPLTSPFLFS